MKIIVGLGNPGAKYELTRHNIGFLILDFFCAGIKTSLKAGKGDWMEGFTRINDEDVYLLKPTGYMNNSGVVLKEFFERKEIEPFMRDLFVIVDDFQIPLGMIRIRKKGNDGGHNGLADIIYQFNSNEFTRMRAGIGKDGFIRKDEYVDYVLSNFTNNEIELLKKLMPVYTECIMSFLVSGLTKTMNTFNRNHITGDNIHPDIPGNKTL